MEENNTSRAEQTNAPADFQLPEGLSKEQLTALAEQLSGYVRHPAREPFTEAELEEAREEATLKARKRRRRAFYDLITRLLMIVIVVYVLCFHIIGLTTMPNGDMYPRIDAGDLVLYYRLDRDVRAQDIVALEKKVSDVAEFDGALVDIPDENPAPAEDGEPEESSGDTAEATAAPVVTPAPEEKTPAERVEDQSFLGKFNRLVYNVKRWLNLSGEEGAELYICRVVAGPGDTVEIPDEGGLIVNGNHMVESNIFSQTSPYVGFVEYPLTLGEDECFVLADRRSSGADSRFFGPVKKDEILGTVITIVRRNNL